MVVNVSELIVLGVVIGFKGMSVVEMAKTVLGWKVFEDRHWGADVRAEVY
jgi:hypothetical protein